MPDLDPDLGRVEVLLLGAIDDAPAPVCALVGRTLAARGKRLRPALLLAAARIFEPPGELQVRIAAVLELVHQASLVHDDVLDGGRVRHGEPAMNARSGNVVAVLVGDYLLAQAFRWLALAGSAPALDRLTEAARRTCEGELLQTLARGDLGIDEAFYLRAIEGKTAALFAAACELGGALSGADRSDCETLGTCGRAFGMAFQIADDCLDLRGDDHAAGKTLATDLGTCQATLPLIHLLGSVPPEDRPSVERLVHSADLAALRVRLEAAGAFAYAEARVRGFLDDALRALGRLPAGPHRSRLAALVAGRIPEPIRGPLRLGREVCCDVPGARPA